MKDPTKGDSLDWTPGDACRNAADECDKHDADAALVLILSKGKDGKAYNTAFRNAGLTSSEAVALLEIMKHDFLRQIKEADEDDETPDFLT